MKKHLNLLLIAFALACTLVLAQPLFSQQTAEPRSGGNSAASVTSAPVSAQTASNQAPKTPEELFARARKLSDLEAAGVPFHLKATFVATGDAEYTGNGTYEEWWASKDVWRKEATLGNYTWVQIQNGPKLAVYGSSGYVPLRLREAVGAVTVQIPSHSADSSSWDLTQKKIKGMDSVILSRKWSPDPSHEDAKILEQNVFTSEGILRIQRTGSIQRVYNNVKPFQTLSVPRSVEVVVNGTQAVSISIAVLESWKADENTLSKIPTHLKNSVSIMRGQAGEKVQSAIPSPLADPDPSRPRTIQIKFIHATPSRLIHQPSVKYPKKAKQQHIQGAVIVEATIDQEGRIREPFVLASPSPLLSDAALKAVRAYRFEPTMIDGNPIAVGTTITFQFTNP